VASRLHVLLVAARYLPFVGGIELHVHEVSRRLAARGVDVTILTTDPSRKLPRRESADGVRIRRVPAWPRRSDYYFAPAVYGEIRRIRPDVVHVQGYQTLVAPVALAAAHRSRLPTVLTFHAGGHSSRLRNAVRPLQLAVLRPLLARADRLIALAPFEAHDYAERLRISAERFSIVPNGSDLPVGAARDVPRAAALVASLGRLERYKGHHRVLSALPLVAETRPDVRLWIAGRGSEEPALVALARDLGVDDRVDIRAVPPEDRALLARELARVNVAVSLSEFETQPIAALEALSLGCKLVVADSPGLRELANDGLATKVPANATSAEVAATILRELEQPQPDAPPKLPTWDDCAAGLHAIYSAVARPR
jgi:glycosyltransferase involved in cell wall biosynthesis